MTGLEKGSRSGRQKPATRDSWQNKPLPESRSRLQLDRIFSSAEYEQIKLGFIPQDMDDKWFIYLEADTLYMHRSWTGNCIYQLRLQSAGGGYKVTEVWVNRDPSQHTETDDNYDADFLKWLIDFILLGRDVEMPRPRGE